MYTCNKCNCILVFFFSSRRRHTRWNCDWSSDVCSSDLAPNRVRPLTQGRGHMSGSEFERENIVTGALSATADSKAAEPARERSEERRVGKECRSRWSTDH